MKKIKNGKEYIQIKDIIFMGRNLIGNIPKSLWEKIHTNDIASTEDEREVYIELTTKEEKDYISKFKFIENKNYLDILDYNQIERIINKLLQRLSSSKEKDIEIVYQYNCLLEYIKDRMEKSCSTCNNKECEKDEEDRIGLEKDGKPVGYNCKKYTNKLLELRKY